MRGLWEMLWTWICSFSLDFPDPDIDLLEEEFDE